MQLNLVKYRRLDFFFRNHLKFSKFLELNVLNLESKITFYSDLGPVRERWISRDPLDFRLLLDLRKKKCSGTVKAGSRKKVFVRE